MTIYIGSDHGGFSFKEAIKPWLIQRGYEVEDLGAHTLNPTDDYPMFAFPVAARVKKKGGVGILFCRSGGGMAIAANRVDGIRAVDCMEKRIAERARTHNNANIITLPADWISLDQAKDILTVFLTTPFSEAERHIRRIAMIDNDLMRNA